MRIDVRDTEMTIYLQEDFVASTMTWALVAGRGGYCSVGLWWLLAL